MARKYFQKAQPTAGDVHVNRPLTDLSIAFIQEADAFVADKVFPTVPVQKRSDQFFTYPKDAWFRIDAQKRAPGTESAGSGWELSTDEYFADKYAIHKDVDDDTRANADAAINVDNDATRFVTMQCMLIREQVWMNEFFTTSVWDTDLTGVAAAPGGGQFLQWDVAGSTPIQDIRAQIFEIQSVCGFAPNTLVLGPRVWQVLQDHPDFQDRIKFTQTGFLTVELLARLLDIERVFVANAVVNTAVEGATAALDFFASKAALLVYSTPNPGLLTPTGGYIFAWTGLLGAGAFGNRIKRFRMEELESDRIECEIAFDAKLISSALGTFFTTAVS